MPAPAVQMSRDRFTSRIFRLLLPAGFAFFSLFQGMAFGTPLFKSDKVAKYEEDHTTWVYPPWEHTWGVVRATQAHLTFFTFGKATFINPQGLAAVKLIATDDPDKQGDDDEVTVYGIDSGENSIIYNKSMQSIGLYGYEDEREGNLLSPWDVAALPNGLVFVTDSGHRRVVKLRNVKGELRYEGAFGIEGSGQLVLPRGIDVTDGGTVVVADAGGNAVVLFDTSGAFVRRLEGFQTPVGMAAVDRESPHLRPRDEYFVVSDSLGRRLRKVRFDGTIVAEVNVAEVEQDKRDPYIGHIAIDLYNNIACTDSVNCHLLKFDPQLHFLSSWGEVGKGRAKFNHPTGITIWRRYGQTFVAEATGAQYLWVGVDLTQPPELTVDPKGPVLRMQLSTTERARAIIELVDKGEVVRMVNTNFGPGPSGFNWVPGNYPMIRNGRVERTATPLHGGEYSLRIRLRASYSSRKVFERVFEAKIDLPEAPQPETDTTRTGSSPPDSSSLLSRLIRPR
ncbi:MAG: NHL repeat-containing protein [bacterium]